MTLKTNTQNQSLKPNQNIDSTSNPTTHQTSKQSSTDHHQHERNCQPVDPGTKGAPGPRCGPGIAQPHVSREHRPGADWRRLATSQNTDNIRRTNTWTSPETVFDVQYGAMSLCRWSVDLSCF